MTVSLITSEVRQTDLNHSCSIKMYSTLKHIHSWLHRQRIAMVVALASSPHQRLRSSCYTMGSCPPISGPSPRSSPRLFLSHGLSSSYWYVVPLSFRVVPLLSVTDDTLWVVLVVGSRAPTCPSPLLAYRALFCTLARSHRRPPYLVLVGLLTADRPYYGYGRIMVRVLIRALVHCYVNQLWQCCGLGRTLRTIFL
jgi:hypothetical protein